MKVCYVTHKSNLTGASQSLLDMLSGWTDYDLEPVVLMPTHGPLEEELLKLGIKTKIIRYTNSFEKFSDPFWRTPLRMAVNTLYGINMIKRFMMEEKIDIVHNNSFLTGIGMQAAYELSIPYICHLREFVEEDHEVVFINNDEQYNLLKNAYAAVAISNAICKKYRQLAADTNIITIYNSVNAERFYINHETILSSNEVNLLLPGRITKTKRQIDAIKAIEILNKKGFTNVRLTIIGKGDQSNYEVTIRKYVEQNCVSNITFLPFGDLKELWRKSDIGLMCSSHEAMGRVTIESMLSGCLTIGANAGATPELIEDGVTGYLYNVEDPNSLADTIIKAILKKEDTRRIAKNAQKFAADNFGVKKYCEQIYEIYQRALRETK